MDETEAERVLGMGGWYATWGYCTWYAARYDGRGRPRIYMHTLIAGFKEPDHVNLGGEDTRPAFTRLYRLCLYPSLP